MLCASGLSLLPAMFIPQPPFLPVSASCREKCALWRAHCQLSCKADLLLISSSSSSRDGLEFLGGYPRDHPWLCLLWPEVCKASQDGNPSASSNFAVIFLCFKESHTTRVSVKGA